jgi:hypothetical protein
LGNRHDLAPNTKTQTANPELCYRGRLDAAGRHLAEPTK